jgi:hypothetical protein
MHIETTQQNIQKKTKIYNQFDTNWKSMARFTTLTIPWEIGWRWPPWRSRCVRQTYRRGYFWWRRCKCSRHRLLRLLFHRNRHLVIPNMAPTAVGQTLMSPTLEDAWRTGPHHPQPRNNALSSLLELHHDEGPHAMRGPDYRFPKLWVNGWRNREVRGNNLDMRGRHILWRKGCWDQC